MHREGPGRSHHMSGGQGVRVSTFPCAIHPAAALPSYSEKGGGGKGRFIFAKVSFFPAKKKTWRMEEGGKEKETEKSPFLFLLHPIPGSLNGFFPLPSSSLFFFPVRTRARGVFSLLLFSRGGPRPNQFSGSGWSVSQGSGAGIFVCVHPT